MPGRGDSNSQPVLSRSEALLGGKPTRDDQMHAHAEDMEPIGIEDRSQYISGPIEGHAARGRRL
jgi:hypothetical protein